MWILENAGREWGVDRFAIGGASAGGNLVAVTLQRLRDRHDAARRFVAANMQFGVYDLSGTPSQINLGRVAFRDLYLPTTPASQRKVADISPLYGDLRGMPPALFTVGTLDYLYDDSLFMAARWHAAGKKWERPRLRIVFLTCSVERAYHILAHTAEIAANKNRTKGRASPWQANRSSRTIRSL